MLLFLLDLIWGLSLASVSRQHLYHLPPPFCRHTSSPRELYHILNLVIGWQSLPLPEWWLGGIDKTHNAKQCVLLFLSLHLFLSAYFSGSAHFVLPQYQYPRKQSFTRSATVKWTLLWFLFITAPLFNYSSSFRVLCFENAGKKCVSNRLKVIKAKLVLNQCH